MDIFPADKVTLSISSVWSVYLNDACLEIGSDVFRDVRRAVVRSCLAVRHFVVRRDAMHCGAVAYVQSLTQGISGIHKNPHTMQLEHIHVHTCTEFYVILCMNSKHSLRREPNHLLRVPINMLLSPFGNKKYDCGSCPYHMTPKWLRWAPLTHTQVDVCTNQFIGELLQPEQVLNTVMSELSP